MKFYVVKNLSKKTNKEYIALVVDLSYRVLPISFDNLVIAEVSGLSFSELYALKVGDKVQVGEYKSLKVRV